MSSIINPELIKRLMKIVGNEWVKVSEVEKLTGIHMDIDELYLLNKSGSFEVMYSVLEGNFYIRLKPMESNNTRQNSDITNNNNNGKFNMQKLVETLRREVRELIPKPEFEGWLAKYVGESWQLVYNQLLNDGVIEEEVISGMVFVRVRQ